MLIAYHLDQECTKLSAKCPDHSISVAAKTNSTVEHGMKYSLTMVPDKLMYDLQAEMCLIWVMKKIIRIPTDFHDYYNQILLTDHAISWTTYVLLYY